MPKVFWQWCRFEELANHDLYQIIAARISVFIVEQDCPYQECDGLDQRSWHLTGWIETEAGRSVGAYVRVVEPGIKYTEPSIGRVITTAEARGAGLGRQLMQLAVERTEAVYPGQGIRISAQQYLEKFYSDFGFEIISEPYDEDGIPHVEMVRGVGGT